MAKQEPRIQPLEYVRPKGTRRVYVPIISNLSIYTRRKERTCRGDPYSIEESQYLHGTREARRLSNRCAWWRREQLVSDSN